MPKVRALDGDSSRRAIPSVERILSGAAFGELIAAFGRTETKHALAEHLDGLRASRAAWDERAAAGAVRRALQEATASTLRPVINGSGVIIHTNLGRSPVDPALWSRAGAIVEGYSNLEFDLESGERGARDLHIESLCRTVFGS